MTLEQFALEKNILDSQNESLSKVNELHESFESRFTPDYEAFISLEPHTEQSIAQWAGVEGATRFNEIGANVFDIIKQMKDGIEIDGKQTLGLGALSEYKINPEYVEQNLKQQAGYAAEIVSTAKDNIQSIMNKDGLTTYRADDRPDLFAKNDQYVDKIRVDQSGNIIERIQVKFIGNDGASCLDKLMQKKFDKYFTDGRVDKLEIPSDYYDQIKNGNLIQDKIDKLSTQLEKVKELGKDAEAKAIEQRIDRYKQIDSMLERSSVSSQEALDARINPEKFVNKIFNNAALDQSLKAGLDAGIVSAEITAAVSTVDNIYKVYNGEISPKEAFFDVAKDTTISGVIGGGTAFISSMACTYMAQSSHALIQSLSNTALPASIVAFGVQSFDEIVDYAKGEIDGTELAYKLGGNAVNVAGAAAGMAIAAATVPVTGPVGAGVGILGCLIGTAVASEAYKTAVELGTEGADLLLDKAKVYSDKAVEMAQKYIPDSLDGISAAITDFKDSVQLPFDLKL